MLAPLGCAVAIAGCAAGGAGDEGTTGARNGQDDSVEALVDPSVVVADARTVEVAEALPDRIRAPLSAAERYRSLAPGAIFVGARGGLTSGNPDGFLRRVVSIAEEGDALVIMTEPATLTDAIIHGAVRTSSGGSGESGGSGAAQEEGEGSAPPTKPGKALRGIEIDFADKPLFTGVDEVDVAGRTTKFTETIRLDRAILTAKPIVDIDLDIRDGKVKRFAAKVQGVLDTVVRATATVTADGVVDDQVRNALIERKHDVERLLYKSARIPLPTLTVGNVPISPTVQFTVVLRCQLAFGGPLVAHAGVDAKSLVRLGAEYNGNSWGTPIRSDFDIRPMFSVERGGEVDARCALEADAELSAYGSSSVTMSVAPYVEFGVKREGAGVSPAYRFRARAGATGAMRGRADVFGVPPSELERPLVEWRAADAVEGVTEM